MFSHCILGKGRLSSKKKCWVSASVLLRLRWWDRNSQLLRVCPIDLVTLGKVPAANDCIQKYLCNS